MKLSIRLFHLLSSHLGRPVIGYSCCPDHYIRILKLCCHSLVHLSGRGHINCPDTCRMAKFHRTAYQNRISSTYGSCPGKCISHATGGMVGQKPHRIQSLPGGAGGNYHLFPSKYPVMSYGKAYLLVQIFRLRHLSCSDITARQISLSRIYNCHAIFTKLCNIIPGHLLFIHTCIHGRGYDHRCRSG